MAWKNGTRNPDEMGGAIVNLTRNPDVWYSGTYVGKREVDGKFGAQTVHDFVLDDGSETSFYGFGHLNFCLAETAPGAVLKFRYVGKEYSAKAGKEIHICEIYYDDGTGKAQAPAPAEQTGAPNPADDLPF